MTSCGRRLREWCGSQGGAGAPAREQPDNPQDLWSEVFIRHRQRFPRASILRLE